MKIALQSNNFNYSYKNNINNKNDNRIKSQVAFTSVAQVPKSKLLNPWEKKYAKLVIWIRENYHKKFINSKFMSWFLDKTENVQDMATHMMVAGSTLISAMYIVRTLQNDKLDKQKRKTLAINDVLTWGLSTIGSYAVDKSLSKKWEGLTRRFAAIHIKKYTDPEFIRKFEEKESAIKAECIASGKKYTPPEFNPRELLEKCKANNITPEHLNKNIQDAANKIAVENYKIDLQNNIIKAKNIKLAEGAKPLALLEKRPLIKNIKDFNVEVLQFKPLTNKLKGMSLIKSIFILGMMYRYIVPVLVMKPANKIGAYLHKKKEQEQAQAAKKA